MCVVRWYACSMTVCLCNQGGVDVCNTQIYNHSSRDQYTDVVQKSVICEGVLCDSVSAMLMW